MTNKKQFNLVTDAELLESYYADNNQEWIGILLERYTLLLFGVCMKYLKDENDAKDCVQQIFLKVLTEVPKYKIDFFKSWLYMVAKNQCLMRLREKGTKSFLELKDQIQTEDHNEHNIKINNISYDLLEDAINELNGEQKQCVILFYLKKLTYQQISEFTGYQTGQVKSYIQNGKRNLKIILERKIKISQDGKK